MKNVLIIDDDQFILDMFIDASKNQTAYEIFPFSEALKALSHFRENSKKYHIIFLDMILPDITGFEMIEQIVEANPEIPIIAISGIIYKHPKNTTYFVEKPISIDRFENLIEIFSL
ncbi:MAG: response regulator [Desulfobacteraceae bacterium]|nr:response regulator [Desulfobacteraceae bacterium]